MKFRTKTVVGIAMIELTLLSALIFLMLQVLYASNASQLTKRVESLALLASQMASDAVVSYDLATIQALVKQFVQAPEVVYVSIQDMRGHTLGQAGDRKLLARPFAADHNIEQVDDGIYDYEQILGIEGQPYGVLRFGLSVQALTEVVDQARHKTLMVAGAGLLLSSLFSVLLGTILTRRLKTLIIAADRLAEGDYGYQVAATGSDEMARVARAFNSMSGKLASTYRAITSKTEELKKLNEDLEDRVRMRTELLVESNEQLKRHTLHDPLTGLPNRLLYQDRLTQAMSAYEKDRAGLIAVAFIDLDGFKQINDTYGHAAGDAVLKEVGIRLAQNMPAPATVARLSGDEFALVLHSETHQDALAKITDMHAAITAPMNINEHVYGLGGSVGVAYYPKDGNSMTDLMHGADSAMYAVKRAGGGVREYRLDEDTGKGDRQHLIGEVRAALNQGGITLHYQPKYDYLIGKVVGMQGRVRWEHPTQGLLKPHAFLEAIDEAGLMRRMTLHLISVAIKQSAVWRKGGIYLPISVRIDNETLLDPELTSHVVNVLNKYDVPGEALDFCIQESGVMINPARAQDSLKVLSDHGLSITVEDFGVGYSSIGWVSSSVTRIKIGRQFVLDMGHNERYQTFVQSLIAMAHALDFEVVADGVESEVVSDELRTLGCNHAVGYYISAALPPAEIIQWYQSQTQDIASAYMTKR